MNSTKCVQGSANGTNGLTDGTIGTCTSGFANCTMEPGIIGKICWYHWENLEFKIEIFNTPRGILHVSFQFSG